MAITYHSGRRIQATQADFDGTPAVSGGWKEVGRTTLGSTGDDIDVIELDDKRYYMLLNSATTTGSNWAGFKMGNGSIDSGSNYARRLSRNGVADATGVSLTNIGVDSSSFTDSIFGVSYIANLSANEKLFLSHQNYADVGASVAPNRVEGTGKYAYTSNPIDQIRCYNGHPSGSWLTGSELVVLGWDPSDTHTSNFWEELASVDLSGGAADTLSSGTITAKKYLWVQLYVESSGVTAVGLQFNGDTSTNYANRQSLNGAADGTSASDTMSFIGSISHTVNKFHNIFIVNNSANEKLSISNGMSLTTAGAGTAPQRREAVSKWANTSAQITSIVVNNVGAGDMGTGTLMKVWGSD